MRYLPVELHVRRGQSLSATFTHSQHDLAQARLFPRRFSEILPGYHAALTHSEHDLAQARLFPRRFSQILPGYHPQVWLHGVPAEMAGVGMRALQVDHGRVISWEIAEEIAEGVGMCALQVCAHSMRIAARPNLCRMRVYVRTAHVLADLLTCLLTYVRTHALT